MTSDCTLLLFDIDGTLMLRASTEHREALHDGIREVYSVSDPASVHVDAGGRTDLEIARLILLSLGVTARHIDEGLRDLRIASAEAFAQRCPPDLSATVAPGMVDLLGRLEARPDVRLSLVTGNLEPIARLKLKRAGLGHWFPRGQGGFGSDDEDRTELPAIARQRASAGRAPHPPERTIVIGDTPRDIACARADGCRVIAIATGPNSADELRAADAVVEDTAGLERALGYSDQ
ncbi:MAG: phosphoglycolate phosphatase [Solirubrobacteraceae bacterium]|nr:phosphoglycolate phosphatase [Solirubrobacteraceae bacterium]